ncbi:hypothetical protein BUALT_Bualt02G0217500 [Buddleja alternifolia]|uniref:Bifunctional inhibitor/plant lipid transfer protein/seed storage helical domain-containing protein n=1 Tax=Buddleja alternifolia TaxID=168488 RepID=A0AAV6Y3D4_9LAMI|nr:hypothetical protein BUALT_Bualt02G0217500 [Buddleja alternifolia]
MAFSSLNPILAILLITSLVFKTNAQISTPCTASMITTFTPCLNFVTGSSGSGSSPTQECCDSLKTLMADSMDCTCLIVTGNVPVSIPFVNRSLGISLPRVCKSSVPIQCKASGVPLPAPGPVLFRPPLAPAASAPHSHRHSPSPTPTASKSAAAAVPPPDDHTLDIEPAAPPEYSLGPSSNPGIRPVVNPNSASNALPISFPSIALMFVGIMAFKFFFVI